MTRTVLEHTPSGRSRRQDRTGRLVVVAVLGAVTLCDLDYALAVVRPGTRAQVWLAETATDGYPTWIAGPALLIGVAIVLLLAEEWRLAPIVVEPLIVACHLGYSLSTRISPMTGDQPAWLHYAGSPLTPSTEPLAAAVYKVVFALSGGSTIALQHVAPVVGVFALATLLPLVRSIAIRLRISVNLARGFIFATPFSFWYITGYIENTFVALPALFLCMSAMLRWSDYGLRRRDLVVAGALFGLCVSLHGEFLALAPPAVLWACTRLWPRSALVAIRDVAVAVMAAIGVVAAVVGILTLFGLKIVTGAASGGYDDQILTPLQTRPNDSLSRFSMFSHGHLIQLDNIVVHAAPLLVVALPVVLAVLARRRVLRARLLPVVQDATVQWLAWLSIGYLAFAALWGFDFGMVGDVDLMLTMDVPFALLVLVVMSRLLVDRQRIVLALIVGSAWANIAFYSLKVGTTWWS